MRQLVPTFISERLAAGRRAGRMAATCLFVDTAGFTPLTSALMAYGVEGTEVTAQILHTIFEPLVRAVYAWGGFVAGFAGDSLKAVFPGTDRDAARRCLLAADAMRQHMAAHRRIATRFGDFDFAAKICLADGDVSWSIWEIPGELRQAAAYTISGPGLARCLELDAMAGGGEIALTPALAGRIDPAMAELERRAGHALLRQVSPELTARHALAPLPAANPAAARRFMPDNVLGLRAEGEFRQVVSVFLNLRELPAGAEGDAFLARFFALLERHGGYLCRIGRIGAQDDGATALLFWGAPVSFEHDLRRALDFLAELRRESPAPLRAGVTSQLAYAGFVGADIHAEYTCYGAAVNLAARLMVRAEWGEALLDEDAAHQARATHRCLPRGAVRLKGFAAEQPVFALQDSRDWRPEPERELVGRGRELGRLRELLAPLRAGRGAGTILVTGEAGMGKSRLLAAAREGGPVAWLRCQADQVARESLHPFRAFLRHHFAFSLELSGDENLGLFQFGMESLGAAVPDPALRRELEAAAPALAGLLDLPWPDQPPAGNGDSLTGASPAPEGQERFAAAVNALKTLFKAESLCQPVVVEVEDGHWLDGDSLACLHHLGRNIADYPLAIVVAAREAPAGLAAAGQSIPTITLRPLDAAELAQLAAQVLGGPASREHLVALAERSEGNPYLAEQLLLADMDDQIADARVTTQHDDDSGLPATARALLTARIDRLEPAVRHAVQVAAILGREVAPELLRAMLDNDPALPDQLRAAAAAGIWQATAAGQLLFSHDLLRDAAYDMQLRSWRRRMHGRAAALLAPAGEPGLVAHHFERAGDRASAAAYLERAVEQDSRAYANRSALDRCRRLIGLLRAGEATDPAAAPKLVRALISQSNLGVRLADWPAARAAAEEALGLAIRLGDTAACVEIWGLLGEIARNSNDHQQALEYYGLALDYYESRGDQLNAARTLNRMALNQQDQGAYDEAMRSFERALALNQAVGDQDVLAHILNNKGLLHWRQSDYRAANTCYREALRISQARGDLQRAASVIGNLGLLRWHEGDLDEALECYQQAHALHERLGNRAGMATSLGNQALLYAERCDYEQAVAIYRRAIDGDRELGNEAGLARHLGNLGLIFGNQGRFDEALTHHQQALEIDQRLGKRADVARHMGNLAEIWRHKGEFAQALALYDQTVPLLRELGATYYLCWQLIQQAETLLLCGRPAEAAPLNAEGLALALKAGDPSDVFQGQLLAAQLLAAGGEPERARQRLETLLAGREEARERAVLFHALWRLGGEEGHRQQAIRLYRGAYAEMPNVLDGRRLEELLAGGWTEPWPAPAAAHSGTMEP